MSTGTFTPCFILQDIDNVSDEKLGKLAKHLLTLKPGADLEEAKTAAQRTYDSIQIVYSVQLSGQYNGDVTLIKAESSTRLPGLTPDYSLSEVTQIVFQYKLTNVPA